MRPTTGSETTRRPSRATYHPELARREQATFHSVDADLRGQEVELVHSALLARLREQFPGAELDESNLQKVAAAISRGVFRHGWARDAGPGTRADLTPT